MPEYTLECTGDVREVYSVHADSEDEARAMFETGKIGPPTLSEASTDIDSITEEPGT